MKKADPEFDPISRYIQERKMAKLQNIEKISVSADAEQSCSDDSNRMDLPNPLPQTFQVQVTILPIFNFIFFTS